MIQFIYFRVHYRLMGTTDLHYSQLPIIFTVSTLTMKTENSFYWRQRKFG